MTIRPEIRPGSLSGAVITAARMDDEHLFLQLGKKLEIAIWDKAQNCCEIRHMTCDDDLKSILGARFISLESREVTSEDAEHDCVHEQNFVILQTSLGFITLVCHNEHNGYYSGFSVVITLASDIWQP